MYKKSRKYKNCAKGLADIKDCVQVKACDAGFIPKGLQLRDSNGKLVQVTFDDICNIDAISEQDIDDMLFILHTFNIPLKG